MFTLFRKLRKSVFGSSNDVKSTTPAGRYLLYAIGEIALVVMGILIALQVNNWNTQKNISQQRYSVLSEVSRNIEQNINEARLDETEIVELVLSTEIVLNHIRSGHAFHDSLIPHIQEIFVGRFFNGVISGYTVLKNNPDIELSGEISFALTSYFEESLEDLEQIMNGMGETMDEEKPVLRKFFKYDTTKEPTVHQWVPKSYSVLKNDDDLVTSLVQIVQSRRAALRTLSVFIETSESLQELIRSYLEE